MKSLRIADDLKLPIDAVCQTFAILAKRGVGKTHTASVMAEEMLKLGQPIVVYDPTGAWWGLKSSADGNRPGYPVVVFGGEHADVPLEESAGSDVAAFIVEKRIPAILDCSLMRKGERIRFMTSFCESLYHLNRESLHFFVDEAQTIAPQNLKAMPEAARLLGAMEDIVLQGRKKGLGMTIISPRPAVVNTNLRSACEVIVAMQIVAPHDRKAIQEWVDVHGDDQAKGREMMETLSKLKRGEAWVWSPSWLEIFKQVKFRGRETFDSSATPAVGERIATPKKLAEIDLQGIKGKLAEAIERAKENDPARLKAKIRELEKAKPADPDAIQREAQLIADIQRLKDANAVLGSILEEIAKMAGGDVAKISAGVAVQVKAPERPKPIQAAPQRTERKAAILEPRTAGVSSDVDGPTQKIVDALAWWGSIGVSAPLIGQVALVAGYSANGGSFKTYLSRMTQASLITRGNGRISLEVAGVGLANVPSRPATLDEFHRRILEVVKEGPLVKLLSVLMESNGEISTEGLGEATGYEPGGGSFKTYLSRLSSWGLIDRRKGFVYPTELLFPKGL